MKAAAVVLCVGWLAAIVGSGAAAGCLSAPVASEQVKQVVQLARQRINRDVPFAANVTAVMFACKQEISGGFNYNVSFNVTNTTCSPATKNWSGCCLRGQPTTCNASATCGGSAGCVLKKLTCGPVTAPHPGCAGCIMAQNNLTAYSAVLNTAIRIFAQQNSGVNPATVKLVEVSTQVVSGINYYFLVTVQIQNTIQVCNLVLYQQKWTNTTTLTSKSCNVCKKQ